MSRSIQQLPSNSGTTSVTEVYSSTGFNAGDPVYFQNGDYKSPANLTAPSSVSFSFSDPVAVNPISGGIVAPSFTYAQMQTGISGGTARRFASVLTNGNIVQAWTNYSQSPSTPNQIYFRIISPSGTVVVGPTVVSATFTNSNYSAVSVVALVGGDFAVGWLNSAGGTTNSVNYAVYTNTGTVVTAATQDTSFAAGASYVPIEMTSLANGGFAIAIKNTSAAMFLRAYSSTGVGAYATISTGITGAGNENSFALASRSDSSVFVCDRTSGTAYQYALFGTGGVAIISATSFSVTGLASSQQGIGSPDASVQTDGTTIVIAFNGNNGTYGHPSFRFLPASNTLSSETIAIPVANLFYQTIYAGGYLSVQCLASNNFVLYFADGYGNMQYAFYNSSGACISGSNVSGAVPIQVTGGFCPGQNRITLLESSGSVYAYWTAATCQQKPVQQVYCRISTTNYVVTPISSVAATPYVVSGVPAGAFIPSTVNPNSLSFYSTASSSNFLTNTPATVSGPTAVASLTCDAIASCTLPNGNFVIAWRDTSPTYTIYAKVYSPTGSELTSNLLVGTSNDGTIFTVKVAALSGGGFVVSYTSTNSVLTFQVYSSGYSPTTSANLAINSFGTTYNYDISGLLDNNFVVFYSIDGSTGGVRVYNSSLTTIYSNLAITNTPQSFAVAGNPWGGFCAATFRSGNGQGFMYAYNPTAANTWAITGQGTVPVMSSMVQNPQLVATQSGMYVYTSYSSGYPSYGMSTDSGPATTNYAGALTSWPLGSASNPTSYPMMGIGMTGNGNLVIATSYNSTIIGVACLPPQMTFSVSQPLPYKTTSTSNVPMFSPNSYNSISNSTGLSAQPRITSGVGNNCVITYRSVSNRPAFVIINGTSLSNVYPIVAGVTPSALTPVAPATTSGVISGVFAGVAITSATAGSTGQLATNGQALLGASYTSTATGAFDSTGAAVNGLKGTFNGRSVNLQGNS
jgi:hypothetical protein